MFAFGSWQGTAGSQRLELSVANVGTTGYHCKELPVPRGWNSWFLYSSQTGNQRLPLQATAGSQRLELSVANVGTTGYHCKELPVPRGWNSWFPTWETEVTIASNCRLPEVGTHASQPGNHRLPLQGTPWNSWFPTCEPQVTIARNCRFPEVGTLGSQPGNHGLPLQATVKMI